MIAPNRHYSSLLGLVAILLIGGAWVPGCASPRTPESPTPADRRLNLEMRLEELPTSTDDDRTIARAALLRALGKHEQALTELEAAIDAARDALDWQALGALWRAVGVTQIEQGLAEKALETFGKRLKAAVSLEDATARASALVDTAWAFALLGHVGQADEAVTEAMVLAKDEVMRDPASVERLGLIADRLNDAERGLQLLEEASGLYRARGDEVSSVRAAAYAAHLSSRQRDDSAALNDLLPAAQKIDDPAPEMLVRLYQSERDMLSLAYDRCEQRANQAMSLADRRGVVEVAKISRVLSARCARKGRHLAAAIERTREAGYIVEDQLHHVTGDVARQELSFEALQIYRLLLSLQVEQDRSPAGIARAFETSERARGRAHLDAVVRSHVGSLAAVVPVSPALQRDRAAAEERVRRLTQALVTSRSRSGLADRHRDALWALEDIKQALLRQNPLLSRVRLPPPANLPAVREQLLDDDSLLLSYFVTEEQVVLFAVSRDQVALEVLKRSSEDIDQIVRRFRRQHLLRPDEGLSATRSAAQALYQELLGPVSALISAKRRLVVIPHGALSSLPFESLAGPDGRFLVETHEVRYGLSSTLALELRRRRRTQREQRTAFVGMGDPVYDWEAYRQGREEGAAAGSVRGLELWNAADTETDAAPRGIERLPATAFEVKSIAKLFGNSQRTFLRAKANETLIKQGALSGARIVHIASHGLLAAHYQALALTLDPAASDDGFLMASEIAELNLDADLVVLSACRTGNTQLRAAEPVAGLALGLRSAGADQVVLSLWSVDDDATAQLMLNFYRPLVTESSDYGTSLAQAKRALLSGGKWQHPYFWAGFVLLGI